MTGLLGAIFHYRAKVILIDDAPGATPYSAHCIDALAAKVIQAMKNDSEPTERDKVRHLFADFIAEGEAKGKADGLREALIAALSRKGIAVTKTATQRIEHCTDAAQLQQWLLNAMTAEKLRDIW